jgi:hypothetical protein
MFLVFGVVEQGEGWRNLKYTAMIVLFVCSQVLLFCVVVKNCVLLWVICNPIVTGSLNPLNAKLNPIRH